MECSNCFQKETPQWRKINEITFCNSCWCYHKRLNKHRNIEEYYANVLVQMNKNKI